MIYHGLITLRLCGFPFAEIKSLHGVRGAVGAGVERGGQGRHGASAAAMADGGRGASWRRRTAAGAGVCVRECVVWSE